MSSAAVLAGGNTGWHTQTGNPRPLIEEAVESTHSSPPASAGRPNPRRRGARWYQWLLVPLHALAVVTQAKSFRDNLVIGSPTLNRWGLHVARRRMARWLGQLRRRRLRSLISETDRAAFERDGFLVKPDFLDDATFRAVRTEVLGLQAEAREVVSGDTLTRLIPLDARNLRALPAVRSVIESGRYRGLLAYVGSFKRRPNAYAQTVFNHVCEAARDEQTFFHCDTFHPTVKSWLYLEDVTDSSMPFVYVPASHLCNRRRLAWERRVSVTAATAADRRSAEGSMRISEREIRRLGYSPPRPLSGAANTLVVADTSGFHARAASSLPTRRIAIYGFSRSNPFLPWVSGDFGALPAVKSGALRLYWAFAEAARRMTRGALDSPRSVGVRSPASPPTAHLQRDKAADPAQT